MSQIHSFKSPVPSTPIQRTAPPTTVASPTQIESPAEPLKTITALAPSSTQLPASHQETQEITQNLANTSTETLQENATALKKTPKFEEFEDNLFDGQKIDNTGAKHAAKLAKKTQQVLVEGTQVQAATSTTAARTADEIRGGAVILPTRNGLFARAAISDRNIGDTGATVIISGGIGLIKQESYLDDGRMLKIRSRQADLSVGVKMVDEALPVPVSGSVSVARSYDVAFARKPVGSENLIQFRNEEMPTYSQVKHNPSQILAEGSEIAFRGTMSVGVSVGAVEPHSHVKFSVGVTVENEFVTNITRLPAPADNPSAPPTYKLRIEPGNHKIDAKASVGWGPFAITAGGGKASTVFYEFEVSEDKLKEFMRTEKLPIKVPDPSRYLGSEKHLQSQMFDIFNKEVTGIKLIGMGATQSNELFAEASATLAKARTTSTNTEAVYVRNGEVLHEDIHSMSALYSNWFTGELKNTLSLTQANQYKKVDGQIELAKEYVGLEASYKIGDTKTKASDLEERLDQVNALLGRTMSDKKLVLPERSDKKWGDSSLSLKVEVTPEVLKQLVELGHELNAKNSPISDPAAKERSLEFARNDTEQTELNIKIFQNRLSRGAEPASSTKSGDEGQQASREVPEKYETVYARSDIKFTLDYMEKHHGVPKEQVEKLLKDLVKIETDPKLVGNEDQIRRTQGIRVAGFLASNITSVVGADEMARVATLQRLVGEHNDLVKVKISSDIHTRKIEALGIEGFIAESASDQRTDLIQTFSPSAEGVADLKARTIGGEWNRFNVGAQKLKQLEQIKVDLANDKLLGEDEKKTLEEKVDGLLKGLNDNMNAQLETPEGRLAVMKGLMKAGSSILPEKIYVSPEEIYDDPKVRGELMDRVIGKALLALEQAGPELGAKPEISGLIHYIGSENNGRVGVEQVFKLLNAAEEKDPRLSYQILQKVDIKDIAALVPRMTDQEKLEMSIFVDRNYSKVKLKYTEPFEQALKSTAKNSVELTKEFSTSLNDIEKTLNKLTLEQSQVLAMPASVSKPSKESPLMKHFKKDFDNLEQPVAKITDKINESYITLGDHNHAQLLSRSLLLSEKVQTLLDEIGTMKPDQRKALFNQLLSQDIMGDASQSLIQRLIRTSQSPSELAQFAGDIEYKARKTKASKADKAAESIKGLAKTVQSKESYTKSDTRTGLQSRLLEVQTRLVELTAPLKETASPAPVSETPVETI